MVVVAALCVPSAGCRQSAEFPGRAPTVEVTMDEYRFSLDPPGRAGRTVFTATTTGRLDHEMVLVHLPEGFPAIREQLRSDTRRAVDTLATAPSRGPGRSGTFAVDLTPGRYALICFVTDPDGEQHARKGMNAEFRVR